MVFYTKTDINELTYQILGASMEVHKSLGPGLLESVYHKCLKHELTLRKIMFESEFNVPVYYKGETLNTDLKCDLLIENRIVIELKSVEKIHPIHEAQLLTYMKLLEIPKGILINFNCKNIFKDGQKTFVNQLFNELDD
jgi:GxxExxY protein